MKSIFTIFSLVFAVQVNASPTKLLEYTFGNSNEASTLQIFSDGTITHGERSCCPKRTEQVPETKLSSAQLAQLQADIEAASNGKLKANVTDMKSVTNTGSLYVYKNSRPIIVLEVEPSAGNITVTTNQAVQASNILRLVASYTKIDP